MKGPSDTICALSTAPGRSAIGVVRVSGEKSGDIFRQIFRPRQPVEVLEPRKGLIGNVVDPVHGHDIDEAVATWFKAPQSYTGEDMTEYSVHGSPVLIAALLDAICASGARLAEPGEFTKRAFLNGKMDLAQAEAVRDIIDAATLFQARIAARQRSGEIAGNINPVKKTVTEIIVELESAVEFVEEDLSLESRSGLAERLDTATKEIRKWIDTYRRGRIVREGFSLAVIGRPNVGKSSIFNALLMQDRSIVMDIPGTTRDLVSEFTSIGGIPVRLLDTAGIHKSRDSAEVLGMDRTYRAISEADAILIVIDESRPPGAAETELKNELSELHCIVVMNKNDLESEWTMEKIREYAENWPWIEVSAKKGTGIEKLRSLIFERIFGTPGLQGDDVLITNLRHCHSLEEAELEMTRAADALNKGLSEEFALLHLHKSLKQMGSITGETSADDILGEIFSTFCIGK